MSIFQTRCVTAAICKELSEPKVSVKEEKIKELFGRGSAKWSALPKKKFIRSKQQQTKCRTTVTVVYATGCFKLKSTHQYFHQVQPQLYVRYV